MNFHMVCGVAGCILGSIGGAAATGSFSVFSAAVGGVAGYALIVIYEKYVYSKIKDKVELTPAEFFILEKMLTGSFLEENDEEFYVSPTSPLEEINSVTGRLVVDEIIVFAEEIIMTWMKEYVMELRLALPPKQELTVKNIFIDLVKNNKAMGCIFGALESVVKNSDIGEDCSTKDAAEIFILFYKHIFGEKVGCYMLGVSISEASGNEFMAGQFNSWNEMNRFFQYGRRPRPFNQMIK